MGIRAARVLVAGLYTFPLALFLWLSTSVSGAEFASGKAAQLLRALGIGELRFSPVQPLYKGLQGGQGSFIDAMGHPWASWKTLRIPVPRFARGEVLLDSLSIRGLKLQLPPSAPNAADTRDWLTQASEAAQRNPLQSAPAMRIGALTLVDFRLHDVKNVELLALDEARLSAQSNREGVALSLRAKGAQTATTHISRLQIQAKWQAPRIEVQQLILDSDLLQAQIQHLRFDGESSRWTIAPSRFKLLGPSPYGRASLELAPSKDTLQGTLHYEAPGGYIVQSTLSASIFDLRNAHLTLQSQCEPCGLLPGTWSNELALRGDLVRIRLQAQSQLRAPEQSVNATLRYDPHQPASLDLNWDSQSLSKIVESLRGRSQGRAKCRLEPKYTKLDCDLSLELQELYPDTQSKGEMSIHASPSTGVEARVRSLRLEAFKQVVHSEKSEAILRYLPDGSLSIRNLALRSLDGRAALKLDAARSAQGRLSAELQAEQWELALLSAFVPNLALSGRLDLSLALDSRDQQLSAQMRGLARRLRWRGLSWGSLSLRATQESGALHLRTKLYGSQTARLDFKARLPLLTDQPPSIATQQQGFRADLQLHHFDERAWAKVLPKAKLGGSVTAKLKVRGSLQSPQATLSAQWNKARWKRYTLSSVNLDAQLAPRSLRAEVRTRRGPKEALIAKVLLPLRARRSPGDFRWNPRKAMELDLKLHSVQLAPLTTLLGQRPLRGQLSAALRLSGSARTPELRAWLSAWKPGYAEYSAQSINFSIVHKAQLSRLSLALFRGQGRIEATARIPLELNLEPPDLRWRAHDPHRLDLRLRELDSEALSGLLDLPAALRAYGELHAQGNLEKHQIWGDLTIDSLKKELREIAMKTDFRLSENRQRIQLRALHRNKTVLRAQATLKRGLRALVENPGQWAKLPSQVQIRANRFSLRELEPWLPISLHEAGGYFSAHLFGQGPLGALTLQGQAQIKSGKIAIVPLQQRIEKIRMRMSVKKAQLRLDTLSAKIGRGSLAASGKLQLNATPNGTLSLKLDKIPLRLPGAPSVEISSTIRSKLRINAKAITLNSTLHKSKIQVMELLTPDVKSIPSNSNIRYSDEIIVASPRTPPPIHAPVLQLNTRIADAILVQGPMVATSWTGNLDLRRDQRGIRAKGQLKSSPGGSFDVLNNHFELERARLEFSKRDGLIPYLDLRCSTEVDGESISIAAQGPAKRPRLSFESSSNASREEIISTLITGSARKDQGGDNKLLSQALSALMLENGKSLSQFTQRLGVDNVRFSFGESLSDTIVSAGSWVSPKVYLESRIRAQAPEGKSRVEGHVRYNFKRDWVLEGYVGDRNTGGGGIWWHRPARIMKFRRAKPAESSKQQSAKKPK